MGMKQMLSSQGPNILKGVSLAALLRNLSSRQKLFITGKYQHIEPIIKGRGVLKIVLELRQSRLPQTGQVGWGPLGIKVTGDKVK
jgi:hypothetical protein